MATSDLKELLTDIYTARKVLNGEVLVEEAADPEHPLHNRFEWDDSIAGHKYRVHQANQLIRSVKIETVPTTKSDGPHFVRAFVSNRQSGDTERNGYSPIEEVVKDDLAYQMMLRSFQRQVNELQRRFGHLKEFQEIMTRAAS